MTAQNNQNERLLVLIKPSAYSDGLQILNRVWALAAPGSQITMRADGAVPLEVISDHMMYQPPAYHEQIIKHFSEGGRKRMMAAVFEEAPGFGRKVKALKQRVRYEQREKDKLNNVAVQRVRSYMHSSETPAQARDEIRNWMRWINQPRTSKSS